MQKKIILLGHRGMLGQMVSLYFSQQGFDIYPINEYYDADSRVRFMDALRGAGAGWVVNCIGKIKQKTDDANALIWANSLLPLDLASMMLPEQFLIHPSTDCVFDGSLMQPYDVSFPANAKDDYGWSKKLGEVALMGKANSIIIRVSIIGPDFQSKAPKGLLGWFLSNAKGSSLNGFQNHWWNGITTLEWCKQLHQLMQEGECQRLAGKIIQLGTAEFYTKYEMLLLFQKYWGTDFDIRPMETAVAVDRRLVPEITTPSLSEQLAALKNFTDDQKSTW
jgi:dTDP-4-dehydrorhamnose reductase